MLGTNERAEVDPGHRLTYALPHGTEESRRGPERPVTPWQ